GKRFYYACAAKDTLGCPAKLVVDKVPIQRSIGSSTTAAGVSTTGLRARRVEMRARRLTAKNMHNHPPPPTDSDSPSSSSFPPPTATTSATAAAATATAAASQPLPVQPGEEFPLSAAQPGNITPPSIRSTPANPSRKRRSPEVTTTTPPPQGSLQFPTLGVSPFLNSGAFRAAAAGAGAGASSSRAAAAEASGAGAGAIAGAARAAAWEEQDMEPVAAKRSQTNPRLDPRYNSSPVLKSPSFVSEPPQNPPLGSGTFTNPPLGSQTFSNPALPFQVAGSDGFQDLPLRSQSSLGSQLARASDVLLSALATDPRMLSQLVASQEIRAGMNSRSTHTELGRLRSHVWPLGVPSGAPSGALS
ncbi:unnamed protein product, partial [Closterium sp. NIES-53]